MTSRLIGYTIVFCAICSVGADLGDTPLVATFGGIGLLAFLTLSWPGARLTERLFIALAVLLSVVAFATEGGWAVMQKPMNTAVFISGFFAALASLRLAAGFSEDLARCGRYLASQPPRRRYLALVAGGHLFSIVLGYGALSLLGTMAETANSGESDPEITTIRMRRMMLAIQRGVLSMLCWSPIALPMGISTTLIAGANWSDAVLPCVVSSAIMVLVGWGIDARFKARTGRPARRGAVVGSWRDLMPLCILLLALFSPILLMEEIFDIRATTAAMIVVPMAAAIWVAVLSWPHPDWREATVRKIEHYVTKDIAGYRNEIVLLSTAAYIGTLAAEVISPFLGKTAMDWTLVSPSVLLIAILWLMPILGQLGMGPILVATLAAPLLPPAESMGMSPSVIVLTFTSGWALSGATSPFTANTMLVARICGVTARHVGVRWNGLYTVLAGLAVSAWIVLVSLL